MAKDYKRTIDVEDPQNKTFTLTIRVGGVGLLLLAAYFALEMNGVDLVAYVKDLWVALKK